MDEALEKNIKELAGPIVVFGAGGFIGANLMRAILSVRDDCFGTTHRKIVPWRLAEISSKNIVYADLNDSVSVEKIFEKYKFRTIFNFAAYGGYSKQDNLELIYKVNILGEAKLLEIAEKNGFSTFVHAGSSSEYGLNCNAPKENSRCEPNSHYAVSKIAASALINYLGKIKKLPVINLRYYSVYGPFEAPDRLIPKMIEMGLLGEYPPLVDPEISRDFVYVDDAVKAAILAAGVGVKKVPGGSINIASGKKTTIKEAARQIKEIFGLKDDPVWGSMQNRNWDVFDWRGDPSFAKEILNWEAETSFREGLIKTINWQKNYKQSSIKRSIGKKISAVITCYGDGPAIPVMYERLTKVFSALDSDYEIIFVNDASPDNSDQILKEITSKDSHVIAVEHSRNFGSQSAFLSGMQISSGDAVVLLDGDLQDPPEMISKFYEKWLEGFEVVYGRRVKRDARRLLNACYKTFYKIFRGMSYIPIPLDAGDFSLIDRKVVNELLALPETDQFLRGLRAWVGFKQTGVDYTRPERMFGVTTNNWRKNIWWAKKAIFSFSFIPLELLSYIGTILFGISILAIIGQVIIRILRPDIPHGISTIIALILFFGAVQILAVSIIGEYLIKIFEETKKRPKFIRRSVRYKDIYLSDSDKISQFEKERKQFF